MTIQYLEPLRRAFERMTRALFQPFEIGKWMVLGFTCFLARLAQVSGQSNWYFGGSSSDATPLEMVPRISEPISSGWEWLGTWGPPLLIVSIVLSVLLVLAVGLLWLSSRGQLMFLDNVLHDRARVGEPWREFRAEGDSLFRWRLVYVALAIMGAVVLAAPLIWIGVTFGPNPESYLPLVFLGAGLLMLYILALVVVEMLLVDFVVPIMHRQRVSASQAWRILLPLLRAHSLSFVLYLLSVAVLWFLTFLLVVFSILMTCCVTAIPLLLPYISTVFMLPIYVTLRWYGLEFLAQIWPDLELQPLVSASNQSTDRLSSDTNQLGQDLT